MENQNDIWIRGATVHEQTKSKRHEFKNIAVLCCHLTSNIPIFNSSSHLHSLHSFSLQLQCTVPTVPSPPPSPQHLSWKDNFFFPVYLFYKDASIHPPPKSWGRAKDSRAAFLPHLLLLCGQGQRGCCWTTFWKEKIWKWLLPSSLLWFYLYYLVMIFTTVTTITTAGTSRLLLVLRHQLELSLMNLKPVFQTFSMS